MPGEASRQEAAPRHQSDARVGRCRPDLGPFARPLIGASTARHGVAASLGHVADPAQTGSYRGRRTGRPRDIHARPCTALTLPRQHVNRCCSYDHPRQHDLLANPICRSTPQALRIRHGEPSGPSTGPAYSVPLRRNMVIEGQAHLARTSHPLPSAVSLRPVGKSYA